MKIIARANRITYYGSLKKSELITQLTPVIACRGRTPTIPGYGTLKVPQLKRLLKDRGVPNREFRNLRKDALIGLLVSADERTRFERRKVKDLRLLAKLKNVRDYRGTRKSDLVNFLNDLLLPRFEVHQYEEAFNWYLRTFIVEGVDGYDPPTFSERAKDGVIALINDKEKPVKLKFIFTCE